jgi:hypothetical protein
VTEWTSAGWKASNRATVRDCCTLSVASLLVRHTSESPASLPRFLVT